MCAAGALVVFACAQGTRFGYGPPRPEPKPHPNILLVTMDTLRADHLGSYGYPAATSPNIDRLAAGGVRFADCTPQWPKTWPSIASLFTGAHPRTTGMRLEQRVLPGSHIVLAEHFARAGYATAAVVANYNLGRIFGFDRGFGHFIESWQERWNTEAGEQPFENHPGKVKWYTDAALVTDQALRWLHERDSTRPFLLWLHYMDTHGPYLPPAKYAEIFTDLHRPQPVPGWKLPSYQIQTDAASGQPIHDLGFYRTQYDRELRYLDDELGRLLANLRSLGLEKDTWVVLSADHGESLGEHEYYLEHGQFSYQPNARVPLILSRPGRLEPGRVVRDPVGLIDVAPTLLELAGLPAHEAFEGQSIAALVLGEDDAKAPEYVFMESGYDSQLTQLSVRQGRWKLIHVRSQEDRNLMKGAEFELYDVWGDPGETRNLATLLPDVVTRLRSALHGWYGSGAPVASDTPSIDVRDLDARSREMLESLGYLDP